MPPAVQTCGPHPCPNLDCDQSRIRAWRQCVGQNQQIAMEGLSTGYTPEQLGIYPEKGGHGSLYNLLSAYGTYGAGLDSACTYDWINGVKRCDKGDVKFAPQPITAAERQNYQYQQTFGEGIQGLMNRLQTEELQRQASWRGNNWTREGSYWKTPNNDGTWTYVDAYGMHVDPATGARTGGQYGRQAWQPTSGMPGDTQRRDWSDNFDRYQPGGPGGPSGPGGPGGLPGFGDGVTPPAGGGPGAALTFDQRIGQLLGLDQGAQAFNLQKAEQDEAERRTYDAYLSDLYGDILGVQFNRPGANPWIQHYLGADIPVPGGGSADDRAVPRGTAALGGAPEGAPEGGGRRRRGGAPGMAIASEPEDPIYALDGGGAQCRAGKVYDPATQKCITPGGDGGVPRGGGSGAICPYPPGDPRNPDRAECRHPRAGTGTGDEILNLYRDYLAATGGALPGGRTLFPPMVREGSYTQAGNAFDPTNARTFGMLAAPLSGIQGDVDAQRKALAQLLPRGGELDRSLAQSTSDAFGRISGLRGDLFQSALGGVQGMAGRQGAGTGAGSGALGSATGLQGQRESDAQNFRLGLMGLQENRRNQQNQLFGGLLGTLGQLGAAAIFKSDKRVKKDIEESEKGLEAVLNLPVYDFTYNKRAGDLAGMKSSGVMAQDVEKVMPEAVLRDEKGIKHVNLMTVLAATMNAVKELDKRTKPPEKGCGSCPGKKAA